MKRKAERTITLRRAVASKGFLKPHFSPGARRFMLTLGTAYLTLFERVKSVCIRHEDVLVDAFERFFSGERRLIIAFRHVAKEDAPVMMYAFGKKLKNEVRQRNKSKHKSQHIITHAVFLYAKDVLNWAGSITKWLFPRIGCIPVQNGGTNRNGLQFLRKEVKEGNFPIALAPEGQVTYHMYRSHPIQPGIATLAAWATESHKGVDILPIAIGYRYDNDPERFIRMLMHRWESESGLILSDSDNAPILSLLLEAQVKTIELLEQFYMITHADELPTPRKRILNICDKALHHGEQLARKRGEGSIIERLFRIRNSAEEAVYPEHIEPQKLPFLGRSMADFRAIEAQVYLRHSQIVDVLEYIDESYIAAPCSAGRACEFALNLLDVFNRISGGNVDSRFTPKNKAAIINIGEPVQVEHPEGRFGKEQLKAITSQVEHALESVCADLENCWESIVFES